MASFPLPEGITALIFDCDGTLADTMPLHYQAWQNAFKLHGREFPEPLFYAMAGIPTEKIIHIFNEQHGYGLPESVFHLKERLFEELIPEVKPIEPITRIVAEYSGRLPMAVATGATRHLCVKTLKQIGLLDRFQSIVTADEVPNGKPAPDIFLMAAKHLHTPVKNCLVFEDGDPGIVAAAAAGMPAVDVRKII